MSYRVFAYGARRPTDGADAALDQMRRRVQLWNSLVEVERAHALAVEAILARLAPGAEESARPGKDAAPSAKLAFRVARKAAFARDDVKAALATEDATRVASVKAATAASGLWWGNSDSVLAAYKTARRRPGDLRFHAWRRERGKISVRYQQGLALDAALACTDTRFQLQMLPPPPERRGTASRRDYTRAIARLRVGSDGRAPVWCELPIRLHRPIPPGAVIRQVEATREMLAGHERWTLLVVVALPEEDRPPRVGPALAVNVGWRTRPDGLRVGYWRTAAGDEGEILVPARWLAQMAKVDDIRSIRDRNFNAARDALSASLKTATGLPDWLAEMTSHLAQWRSPGRLAAVALRWRTQRFAGDEDAYAALEAWRARDRHLWEYEANLRDQLIRERRERYRVFAAWVARTAGSVRLHSFDLRPMAERGPDGKADELSAQVRLHRTRAACSILRLAIEQACAREGVPIVTVPKEEAITQTCSRCRKPEPFDAAARLEHVCAQCGHLWDQDENACRNLLAWTPQATDPPEEAGGLRSAAG